MLEYWLNTHSKFETYYSWWLAGNNSTNTLFYTCAGLVVSFSAVLASVANWHLQFLSKYPKDKLIWPLMFTCLSLHSFIESFIIIIIMRRMRNCDLDNGIYMHIAKHPDHTIAWKKTTFLDYDRNFCARRMKESLYIDIFSETGTMNLEDGMCKNHCWNAIMPILRKEIS